MTGVNVYHKITRRRPSNFIRFFINVAAHLVARVWDSRKAKLFQVGAAWEGTEFSGAFALAGSLIGMPVFETSLIPKLRN